MTRLEKIELAAIPLAGLCFMFGAAILPGELSVGRLLLTLSALLLLQSLIRDLFILAGTRRAAAGAAARGIRCMCVESAIGMTGVVAGAGILGFSFDPPLMMGQWGWPAAAVLTLGLGFAIKDFVVKTEPWRIVRDKDHVNIVVSWRR